MRVVIADDDPVSRRLLEKLLKKWQYEPVPAEDGNKALDIIQGPDAPKLAIVDWMMPGLSGIEICRQVRANPETESSYIIMLTSKEAREDIIAGMEAGADDFIIKPFDSKELEVRLNAGKRIVELQTDLGGRVMELEKALDHIQQLQGLLPICSYCKKIRDPKNYWHHLESYISLHSETKFSHSICPNCYETIVKPELNKNRKKE